MPIPVWSDPRFKRYFQGAESILREFRREVNWGWSMSDPVLARLVDLALAEASGEFTFDARLDKRDGVAETIGRSTFTPRADLIADSTVKTGVLRR